MAACGRYRSRFCTKSILRHVLSLLTFSFMQTQNSLNAGSIGCLGFELSVLRRLKFRSVALPLAGEPNLGLYLKRWNARVAANDPAQWAWTKSQAFVENNSETLTEQDLDAILDDAY